MTLTKNDYYCYCLPSCDVCGLNCLDPTKLEASLRKMTRNI